MPAPPPPPSPKVGIFYYLWYGALDSDWKPPKFVDFPILGNYNSSNFTVIKQHLRWIEDLGVDFVVLSWWGFQDPYGNFTDSAAKKVLNVAEAEKSNLKFAIMVEPFNSPMPYKYVEIYNHVYNEFAARFGSFYYEEEGKPLIFFFNNDSLTPNGVVLLDSRFETVLVGHESYVDWLYTDLVFDSHPVREPRSREVSVTPRYDESRLDRPKSIMVDVSLSQGVYDEEWKNAIRLWQEGKVDTIMITSWNEYPERTAIEPQKDKTAPSRDPYYLYNLTKEYIRQVHP